MLQQELPPNTIFMKKILLIVVLLCSTLFAQAQKSDVIIGAEQTKAYFPILKINELLYFPITPEWWEISTCWIYYWKTTLM